MVAVWIKLDWYCIHKICFVLIMCGGAQLCSELNTPPKKERKKKKIKHKSVVPNLELRFAFCFFFSSLCFFLKSYCIFLNLLALKMYSNETIWEGRITVWSQETKASLLKMLITRWWASNCNSSVPSPHPWLNQDVVKMN